MPNQTREVRPLAKPGHVFSQEGEVLKVPEGWELLPPGDAALSRRLKAGGPCWTVLEIKGGKRFSRGIWAPADRIAALRQERGRELLDPAYQRKLEAGRQRRADEERAYGQEFTEAVRTFLGFHPVHAADGELLARLVSAHALPVGSGTVARTERIPIEERAEAATIAWMRHQTTGYDDMSIPLVKGRRREVRRGLARQSHQLLERYRQGLRVSPETCPLARALASHRPAPAPPPQPGNPQLDLGLG